MDEFAERLKQDAGEIPAEVSTELRRRIDASLQIDRQVERPSAPRRSGINLWWASSLSGLAATVLVLVLINWNRADLQPLPEPQTVDNTVPDYVEQMQSRFRLQTQTADFVDPLEEELEKLTSDIEKARKNLRQDVDFTF